jgi:hypothetical protein
MIAPEKCRTPSSLKDEAAILTKMFSVQSPAISQSGIKPEVSDDLQPGAPYDRNHCSSYDDEGVSDDKAMLIDKNHTFQYAFTGYKDSPTEYHTVVCMPKMWESIKNALTLPSL